MASGGRVSDADLSAHLSKLMVTNVLFTCRSAAARAGSNAVQGPAPSWSPPWSAHAQLAMESQQFLPGRVASERPGRQHTGTVIRALMAGIMHGESRHG
jgi:hypothetical protein